MRFAYCALRGLALAHRRLSVPLLKQTMDSTAKLTSFVLFILIGSTVFSLIFRGVDGDLWVEGLLTGMPGGVIGFLLVPLLAPAAHKLGIDLVWFGVLLSMNMQTSFMHPPFGFSLFYLRSVAPREVKTTDIYGGAIPFVIIQVIMVGLIIAFPGLVQSTPIAQ